MVINFKDIDARAKAISDWVPQSARDKVAAQKSAELEAWMLSSPYESNTPFDNQQVKD